MNDISTLNSTVGTLSNSVTTNTNELTSIKPTVTQLNTIVGTLSNQVNTNTTDIEAIHTNITNTNARLDTTNNTMQLNINEINTRIDNIANNNVDEYADKNYVLVKNLNGDMVKWEFGAFNPSRFEENDPDFYIIHGVYLNSSNDYFDSLFRELTTINPYNKPYFSGIIFSANWFKELDPNFYNTIHDFTNNPDGTAFTIV